MKTMVIAFALGCGMHPAWLCDLNPTWWTHGNTEAAQRAWLLSHCHDTPAAVVCREDDGSTTRISKGGKS